jgi:ubiquinone/menaquinone biosynthesis C-methylase UbiE
MRTRPQAKDRYEAEARFFDLEAEKIVRRKRSFALANTKTHVEIFQEIEHLVPVISFFGEVRDRRLIDLACGDGWASLYFARSGAKVCSCDISAKCIDLVRKYAEANQLQNRITGYVMAAEELKFEDESFDLAFINAGLHHCDLGAALRQIHRVLKKGGKAAFFEDLAHHPVLRIYRMLTQKKHTPHERPLSARDLEAVNSQFTSVEFHYSGLLNIFDSKNWLTAALGKTDRVLLKAIPRSRPYARLVGILAVK